MEDKPIERPQNNEGQGKFPQKNIEREQKEKARLEKEIEEQKGKYQSGQPLTFVKVRFPGNARSFTFLLGKRKLSYGQMVMAQSDRGMAVGYINSFPFDLPFEDSMLPLKYISKVATQEDILQEKELIHREKKAGELCSDFIIRHKLDMNMTHIEFTQYGKKCVFYFTAPARVDFRELVKDLVGELKMRIELRHSSFLQEYGSASIRMAKNQNLTLVNNKINGVCGQLKCCIQYEDEVYVQKRRNLPEEDYYVKMKNGDIGRVTKLHLLAEEFEVITTQGTRRRYVAEQYDQTWRPAADFKFPDRFDHITNETSTVIGKLKKIEEYEAPITQVDKITQEDKAELEMKRSPQVSPVVERPLANTPKEQNTQNHERPQHYKQHRNDQPERRPQHSHQQTHHGKGVRHDESGGQKKEFIYKKRG